MIVDESEDLRGGGVDEDLTFVVSGCHGTLLSETSAQWFSSSDATWVISPGRRACLRSRFRVGEIFAADE
jgi:hypothetical protein